MKCWNIEYHWLIYSIFFIWINTFILIITICNRLTFNQSLLKNWHTSSAWIWVLLLLFIMILLLLLVLLYCDIHSCFLDAFYIHWKIYQSDPHFSSQLKFIISSLLHSPLFWIISFDQIPLPSMRLISLANINVDDCVILVCSVLIILLFVMTGIAWKKIISPIMIRRITNCWLVDIAWKHRNCLICKCLHVISFMKLITCLLRCLMPLDLLFISIIYPSQTK